MAKLAFRIRHLSFSEVIYGSASSDVIKGYLDVSSSALHVLSNFRDRKLRAVIVSVQKDMDNHSKWNINIELELIVGKRLKVIHCNII